MKEYILMQNCQKKVALLVDARRYNSDDRLFIVKSKKEYCLFDRLSGRCVARNKKLGDLLAMWFTTNIKTRYEKAIKLKGYKTMCKEFKELVSLAPHTPTPEELEDLFRI